MSISNSQPEGIRFWIKHPIALIYRCLGGVYNQVYPGRPWISHHAVAYLERVLNKNMIGLEWGSGRSTAWYASRLKFLTSVEHNPEWYKIVKKILSDQKTENVDYRYISLNHDEAEPTHRDYPKTPDYVAVAELMGDDSLDFVVVDGHYRLNCVKVVQRKIKQRGYLLIDNSNWMELEKWGVSCDWKVVHRSFGFFGETTIWQKP